MTSVPHIREKERRISMVEEVLRIRHMNKNFYGNQVLCNVNLNLFRGEVLGIIGGNGTGKTTLAKILSGEVDKDSGTIYFEEEKVDILSPSDAQRRGILCVFHQGGLVEEMTVAENMFLLRKDGRARFIRKKQLNMLAKTYLAEGGLEIPPDTLIKDLSHADRRRVELIRAATFRTKIIILDEITSIMHRDEREWVKKQIERLRGEGVSFIVISHDPDEIIEMCDRIAVMQDGQVVQIVDGQQAYLSMLFALMRQEKMEYLSRNRSAPSGEAVLQLTGVETKSCRNATFSVHRGEILGIYTIIPQLADELADALYGREKILSGEIRICGQKANLSDSAHAARYGIALILGENPNEELLPEYSIEKNISFSNLKKTSCLGIRSRSLEKIAAKESAADVGIGAEELEKPAYQLSGGLKQKLIFANSIARGCEIYVINNAMANVDFNSRMVLYDKILALKEEGKVIVFFSKDFEEIKMLSDRILYVIDDCISDVWFH